MKTIDLRGRGLLDEPATRVGLEELALGVAGHCEQAIFVAYIGQDQELLGCSVLLETGLSDATSAALHVLEIAVDLGTVQLDVLEVDTGSPA